MTTTLKDYVGEPTVEELFPSTQDKVILGFQSLFILGFSLSAYRSAYKRNWGAAIWKTLLAQGAITSLNRWMDQRVAKHEAEKIKGMSTTDFFKNF